MMLLRDPQCPRTGRPRASKTSPTADGVGRWAVPGRVGGPGFAALVACGALLFGCGGGPAVVSQGGGDTSTTAAPPNPEVANPCVAPAIDPALNPCAGVAGPAPAAEGGGAPPAPGAAPTP